MYLNSMLCQDLEGLLAELVFPLEGLCSPLEQFVRQENFEEPAMILDGFFVTFFRRRQVH